MTAIQVSALNKSYGGLKAVDNLYFQVESGECFGFLGPNGAGKTTTMKMLYGKAEPDSHHATDICVFGFNPAKDTLIIKALSGIVSQDDNLDTELNVNDNLYIYAKFYGMESREAKKRITELLDFMELQEKAKVKIRELSGGMQRRLTIARALLNKPQLLILDEPTTGLDPQVRHLIWNKVRELKEMGVTVLLTTHYMEEAYQICDRIIIMDKGKKIMEGKPRELMASKIEAYVMEVHGLGQDLTDELTLLKFDPELRCEIYQDNLMLHSNNSEKLAAFAEERGINDYYIREANLEDLFLKVTGRSLNELQ